MIYKVSTKVVQVFFIFLPFVHICISALKKSSPAAGWPDIRAEAIQDVGIQEVQVHAEPDPHSIPSRHIKTGSFVIPFPREKNQHPRNETMVDVGKFYIPLGP